MTEIEKMQAEHKAAIEKLAAEHKAEIAVLEQSRSEDSVELAAFRAAKKTTEREAFLDGLVNTGRITLAARTVWGDLYDANEAKARERGAALAANTATPVGAAPQSTAPSAPKDPVALGGDTAPKDEFKNGVLLWNKGETFEQYQERAKRYHAAKGAK